MGVPAHVEAEPSSEGQVQASTMSTEANSGDQNAKTVSFQPQPNDQYEDQVNGNAQAVNGQAVEDDELGVPVEVEHVSPGKKRRKKSKSKGKRGLNKPTGMEEFFADAPLTPEQYEEDQSLYEADLPFINRILTAIQRFERTRKLTNERRDIFYKWLVYGGVEVGPNMFQSKDTLDTSNMSKTELAIAMSQVSIGTDKYNVDSSDALYAIDFLGCMKGFLSRRAIDIWGLETREKTVEITTTLERFMDYLLQHDVCPEYQREVTETRNFCRVAADELCAAAEAGRRLPGDFNIACSTIFGGQYAEGYDGETSWAPSTAGEVNFVGFTQEMAKQIINFAIAGQAPEAVYQKHMELLTKASLSIELTKERAGFEITRIEPPTNDTLDIYRTSAREFRPVGTLYAKHWHNPELPPADLTPEERAEAARSGPSTLDEEYIFLIEQAILINLRVGMKLEATLKKLTSGIWYFDEFLNVYPSFDTYLCNELMADYKRPRWLAGSVPYQEQADHERAEEEQRKLEEAEREASMRGAGDGTDAYADADIAADSTPQNMASDGVVEGDIH